MLTDAEISPNTQHIYWEIIYKLAVGTVRNAPNLPPSSGSKCNYIGLNHLIILYVVKQLLSLLLQVKLEFHKPNRNKSSPYNLQQNT